MNDQKLRELLYGDDNVSASGEMPAYGVAQLDEFFDEVAESKEMNLRSTEEPAQKDGEGQKPATPKNLSQNPGQNEGLPDSAPENSQPKTGSKVDSAELQSKEDLPIRLHMSRDENEPDRLLISIFDVQTGASSCFATRFYIPGSPDYKPLCEDCARLVEHDLG